MWIGTVAGLNEIKGKSVIRFTTQEGLSNNNIKNMLLDSRGNIWVGTLGGGLNKYDGKSITVFSTKSGLSDDQIRSIVEVKRDSLHKNAEGIWVSTDNGIDFITNDVIEHGNIPGDNKIEIYKRDDGLKGEDFCSNSGYRDSENKLWWGSVKSLTSLDVKTISQEKIIPDVKLTTLYLDENYVDYRSLKDSIETKKDWFVGEKKNQNFNRVTFTDVPAYCNYPLNLKLPYDINNLSFRYASTDLNSPHKLKYQYILEGADREWHQVTNETKAVYTNLGAGPYTFKVRARGASEIWSEPFTYSFTILPPWWKTLWAYLAYLLFLIFVVMRYSAWKNKALLTRQKELEKTVIERTADIVEEKNKVQEKSRIIEHKQEEILDSIRYAKRIQQSLLTNEKYIHKTLERLRRK